MRPNVPEKAWCSAGNCGDSERGAPPQRISTQGRITIPPEYRDFAGLSAAGGIVVAGVEIGIEIWDRARWQEEQKNLMEHAREKGEREMAGDLLMIPSGKDAE